MKLRDLLLTAAQLDPENIKEVNAKKILISLIKELVEDNLRLTEGNSSTIDSLDLECRRQNDELQRCYSYIRELETKIKKYEALCTTTGAKLEAVEKKVFSLTVSTNKEDWV